MTHDHPKMRGHMRESSADENEGVGLRPGLARPQKPFQFPDCRSIFGVGLILFFASPVKAAACDAGVADVTWDGGAGTGAFHSAANWSTDTVPGIADDVCIPDIGPTTVVTYSQDTRTINSLQSFESFTISGGQLDIATASSIESPAAFTMSGGTLGGAGTVTVGGPTTWTSGSMIGSGATILNSNTTMSGGATKSLVTRTLTNNATLTWSGGTFNVYEGAVINNAAAAVIDITTDADITFFSGAVGTLNNDGLMKKTAGTLDTEIALVLANNASDAAKGIKVSSGELSFIRGGTSVGRFEPQSGATLSFGGTDNFTLSAASVVSGAGTVLFDGGGGTRTINGDYDVAATKSTSGNTTSITEAGAVLGATEISSGTLNVTTSATASSWTQLGGTLGGAGTVTVNGPTTWTSGSMIGSGATILNGNTTMSGSGTKSLVTRTLTNNATLTWSGGTFNVYEGAVINNAAAAVIDITTDADITFFSGAVGTLNNDGLIKKTAGTLDTEIALVLANNASDAAKGIKVSSGELSFIRGGTSVGRFEPQSGATLSFGGTDNFTLKRGLGRVRGRDRPVRRRRRDAHDKRRLRRRRDQVHVRQHDLDHRGRCGVGSDRDLERDAQRHHERHCLELDAVGRHPRRGRDRDRQRADDVDLGLHDRVGCDHPQRQHDDVGLGDQVACHPHAHQQRHAHLERGHLQRLRGSGHQQRGGRGHRHHHRRRHHLLQWGGGHAQQRRAHKEDRGDARHRDRLGPVQQRQRRGQGHKGVVGRAQLHTWRHLGGSLRAAVRCNPVVRRHRQLHLERGLGRVRGRDRPVRRRRRDAHDKRRLRRRRDQVHVRQHDLDHRGRCGVGSDRDLERDAQRHHERHCLELDACRAAPSAGPGP